MMISSIRFAIRLTADVARGTARTGEPAVADPILSRQSAPQWIGSPEDPSGDRDPHHALNTPVGEPDPTEWPDPYDHRPDPRDPADPDGIPFGEPPHPHTGSRSTIGSVEFDADASSATSFASRLQSKRSPAMPPGKTASAG
jgi:hypothetical protein